MDNLKFHFQMLQLIMKRQSKRETGLCTIKIIRIRLAMNIKLLQMIRLLTAENLRKIVIQSNFLKCFL